MELTITEYATLLPVTIDFFEKYGFDYYQNGNISLRLACENKRLNFEHIDEELSQWINLNENSIGRNLMEFEIGKLIDFIDNTFHAEEHALLNSIEALIQSLENEEKTNKRIVYLATNIQREFTRLKEKLIKHFESEDKVFFPYIQKLMEAKNLKMNIPSYHISLIKNPIRILENEHKEALNLLSDIKELTHQFDEIEDSGRFYNDLMNEFNRFEKNIHMHLHIENNILFPKLLEIEKIMHQKIQEKYHSI